MREKWSMRSNYRILIVLAALLAATFCFSLTIAEEEPTIVASGDCGENGDNVTWQLDSNGKLTISGTGRMKDYGIISAPWYYSYNAKAIPHNSAARCAAPFPSSSSCKNLDLPPVNLRFLQANLTKNSLACRPPHLCGIALEKHVLAAAFTFLLTQMACRHGKNVIF